MTDQTAPEPSMDEILASIRRIISEDAPVAEPAHAAPASEPAEVEPEPHAEIPPQAEEQHQPEPDPVSVSETGPGGLHELMTQPEPEPVIAEAVASHEPAADEPLVSEQTEIAAASAFDDLAATVYKAEKPVQTTPLPPPGRTLEDLVAELLRPLLKAWLDENLAEIVRQRVDEEVARIAKGRVR